MLIRFLITPFYALKCETFQQRNDDLNSTEASFADFKKNFR